VYKDIFEPKYPSPTELCKLLTKYESARKYFNQEMVKLSGFLHTYLINNSNIPKDNSISAYLEIYKKKIENIPIQGSAEYLASAFYKNVIDWITKIDSKSYKNNMLEAWKSSDDVFVRKSLRDAVCDAIRYSTLDQSTLISSFPNGHILKEYIWSKTAKEWQASYDAFEHAYDMFCENSKITNPQMRVTNADVKDHLSRMWESMDRQTQNTWNHFAGDTLPIRHRGVRGLDGDFDEEDVNEALSEYLSEYPNEDLDYTLPNRHRRVRGLDGDFEQENFDDEDIDED
jgi:hypothetical protein